MLKAEYDYDLDIKVQREEAWEDGNQHGIEEGIRVLIQDNLEDGKDEKTIQDKLIKRFMLSEAEAMDRMKRYSRNEKEE